MLHICLHCRRVSTESACFFLSLFFPPHAHVTCTWKLASGPSQLVRTLVRTTVLVFCVRLHSWHWTVPAYLCFVLAQWASANTGRFTTVRVSLCSTQLLVIRALPKWLQAWRRLKLTTSPASDDDDNDDDDDDDDHL